MKTLHYSIIVITGITAILVGYFPSVYAPCAERVTGCSPPPWPITVQIDKSLYIGNDTITISGHVQDAEPGKTVHIQIYNSTFALVREYQTTEFPNGTYSLQTRIDLSTTDQYEVHTFVQSGLWSASQFMFIKGPYKLVIGDKTYPINYTITDGKLYTISADNKTNSLTAHLVDTPSGTVLNLELPRQVINATSNNADTNFTILLRGGSADYKNTQYSTINTNADSRTIQVYLSYNQGEFNPSGTWDVKIIGTKIIPEFPFTIPVLLISITLMIIFFRLKFGMIRK